ncbi:GGDEF domain-containing protein [Jiella sp. M17.18]|uniref:GGDEF domain-containing protein n=1 Tax=Jiella sp. M17.18 TaxID=3234247 RepID=UPI0034DF7467
MHVDVPTIYLVLAGIAFVVALAILAEWRKLATGAMIWWAAGFLGIAAGAATAPLRLLPGLDWLAIGMCNLFLSTGFGFIVCGIAQFTGRKGIVLFALPAPAIWLAFWMFCPEFSSIEIRIFLQSSVMTAFSFVASWLLLNGDGNRTFFIRLLACVFAVHGLVHALRVALLGVPGAVLDDLRMTGFAFTPIIFEGAIAVVVIAFLLIAIAREREEDALRQLAETDFLTGIGNRRSFEQNASLALSGKRSGPGGGSIAVLDLDHFKRINDTFGHAFGDDILRLLCATVRLHLGPQDFCGRLGGEEFAVCLPGRTAEDAALVAEAIRRDFAERALIFRGQPVGAAVSVGVAEISRAGELQDALSTADAALYDAKRAGRNRVEVAQRA